MTHQASRREFLKHASALSMVSCASPLALSLAAMGEAAAAGASDYKALVCVFLAGGNDYANTLIPWDTPNYNAYKSLRPVMGLERASLSATVLKPAAALPDGRAYALAPSLAPLMPIFNKGDLAVMLNIGTLVEPTDKRAYTNRAVALPPNLFSHNDQTSYWQACSPEGASSGWGGRMGDILMSGNGKAIFTGMTPAGNALFLSGEEAVAYQTTINGPLAINGIRQPLFGSRASSLLLESLITETRPHLIENEITRLTKRSIDARNQIAQAFGNEPLVDTDTPNPLADQLRMVADMIASPALTGARRQVFFVSLSGFDTHDELATRHPALLQQVAEALSAFHTATVRLGVADQVTTFTASDFGRSWGNDDGSDHGWGSMHLVMGGAVKGQRYYGTAPVVANNGPDDLGQGRLIPTTSVDQLAATLGKWMGLNDSQLLDILPNLRNFSRRNLGFMA